MPEHLTEHHRLVSQQKRAAVLHAADVMIDQGVAFHWTTLARRARVSVKFINDPKHHDLKEQVKEKLAAAYDQQSAQAVAASNATAAQLRVKVANQAAQLRRQDHVIKVLERKLGEQLGSEIAAGAARDHRRRARVQARQRADRGARAARRRARGRAA